VSGAKCGYHASGAFYDGFKWTDIIFLLNIWCFSCVYVFFWIIPQVYHNNIRLENNLCHNIIQVELPQQYTL
jgi:hypothetical protein